MQSVNYPDYCSSILLDICGKANVAHSHASIDGLNLHSVTLINLKICIAKLQLGLHNVQNFLTPVF